MNKELHEKCKQLINAYRKGDLGQTKMPEDSSPIFSENDTEMRIAYFTLPMALNYQRDSYKLWESALKTFNDPETNFVFDVSKVIKESEGDIRKALLKYKLALQPNKHINTWISISKTIHSNWGSFSNFFKAVNGDFLNLRKMVTLDYKKGFPYLSGPKIFNYWSFIISVYGKINLKNKEHIEIAPDTHITQCSVKLGVISQDEANILSKEVVSERWRKLLEGSDIDPIDMHPPLWFWSRNGFLFDISNK